jgi:sugar phosphate permease
VTDRATAFESAAAFEDATYRKVTWRLMPYLFLCYILAYVDRVNVGFAKLQMLQDLRLSDSVYGLGAGIFFIGYFFFEVPGNLIMQRVGARRWIGPIMMVWGVVSSCTMLVRSSTEFYALRFLLGVVESGFFPAVILYLTFWYTSRHRARMVAVFMSAIPLSGVIAGPISGWILKRMTGAGHLEAWIVPPRRSGSTMANGGWCSRACRKRKRASGARAMRDTGWPTRFAVPRCGCFP